jgi:hypothetical protein
MERFYRTLFPGRVQVCGKMLPPLTLWRLAALQAIESPFVSGDPAAKITPADLTLAIRAVTCHNLQAPDLRPNFWAWRWTRKLDRNGKLWKQQAGLFVRWMAAHQLSPELWRDELREPRYITAPLVMSQVTALLKLGIQHDAAWNTSPGYAAWLTLTAAERESDGIKFADDVIHDEPEQPQDEQAIREQAQRDLGERYNAWLAARIKNLYSP